MTGGGSEILYFLVLVLTRVLRGQLQNVQSNPVASLGQLHSKIGALQIGQFTINISELLLF